MILKNLLSNYEQVVNHLELVKYKNYQLVIYINDLIESISLVIFDSPRIAGLEIKKIFI